MYKLQKSVLQSVSSNALAISFPQLLGCWNLICVVQVFWGKTPKRIFCNRKFNKSKVISNDWRKNSLHKNTITLCCYHCSNILTCFSSLKIYHEEWIQISDGISLTRLVILLIIERFQKYLSNKNRLVSTDLYTV